LSRKKIGREVQEELIKVIKGMEELTIEDACEVLMLKPRRYYRWPRWKPPSKKAAWNKITPAEEAAIIETAGKEELVDMRAAGLMVYGHESNKFHCGVSTVQRVLKKWKLQPPYTIPRRKQAAKPDIRELMKDPKKVFSYDATDFYLTSRLRVVVIPMLDLGSRKFLNFGVRVRSFTQKDVMDIWDETLLMEGIVPGQLTSLSDRGGQMKGSRTKAHLIGKWDIKLEFARPYTPDDNAWIEAFIKYMKYHPECPEQFETVQDVNDWVAKYHKIYNARPHSALGYVRPNDEHAGMGNAIRQQRKENIQVAKQNRLAYYNTQKEGASNYGLEQERLSNRMPVPCFEKQKIKNNLKVENHELEAFVGGEDFRANSSLVLCQNR
jgi:transposase InsO family protein